MEDITTYIRKPALVAKAKEKLLAVNAIFVIHKKSFQVFKNLLWKLPQEQQVILTFAIRTWVMKECKELQAILYSN